VQIEQIMHLHFTHLPLFRPVCMFRIACLLCKQHCRV